MTCQMKDKSFYKTINLTREYSPSTTIEILTPDFLRNKDAEANF